MFGRKKEIRKISFDPEEKHPVIHCSICNGEQVAGLKNNKTGAFEEIMVIRNGQDLETFQKMTGTTDIPKEY